MPDISVENAYGVIDGLTRDMRLRLDAELPTSTQIIGTRLKFRPTRAVLDQLVALKVFTFAPECRVAWGHFYKQKAGKPVQQRPPETDFPFKTKPYDHQLKYFLEYKDRKFFSLEWEPGTGKTKTALDVVAEWAMDGVIDALLVITLQDVHENWIVNEVPTHFVLNDYVAAYWNTGRVEAGMRGIIEADTFAIASVNFESVARKRAREFCERFLTERRAALVIDEPHKIKNPQASRTKAILKLGPLAKRRIITGGTPAPRGALDVWSQYYFLSPSILRHRDFYQFKARHAIEKALPGVTYKAWVRGKEVEKEVKAVVGYKNLPELRELLDPHRSRVLKKDCLDLPPKIYRLRKYDLADETRAAYESMKEEFCIELESGLVTAASTLTMLMRLQQIVCGFVTDENGQMQRVGKRERLELVMNALERMSGKVIIWSNFRFSQAEIMETLRENYGEKSVIDLIGATPKDRRSQHISMFQQDDVSRFCVASTQVAGTGITLTRAQDMIYFNNTFDLEQRLQSEDRPHRIGLEHPITLTDLEATRTIDGDIRKSLVNKFDIAAQITGDALREWLRPG